MSWLLSYPLLADLQCRHREIQRDSCCTLLFIVTVLTTIPGPPHTYTHTHTHTNKHEHTHTHTHSCANVQRSLREVDDTVQRPRGGEQMIGRKVVCACVCVRVCVCKTCKVQMKVPPQITWEAGTSDAVRANNQSESGSTLSRWRRPSWSWDELKSDR